MFGVWEFGIGSIYQKELNNTVVRVAIQACAVYEFWKKNYTNTIDKELENEILKEASFWKMVLQRLFDIILTLAKSSLALRGHREDLSQEGYHGNFLSFVELVARYDHILRQVLDMPKGSTRYLSATIQNEMIEILGTKLETHLLEQIRASPFFAIIMDTTQDISKSIDVGVKEVFLGFYAAIKHGAADLVNQITRALGYLATPLPPWSGRNPLPSGSKKAHLAASPLFDKDTEQIASSVLRSRKNHRSGDF
ncbi:52 kDa repressor of the inhibitor of the protein kinase [Eumeta japonica]|uniref:52 kDa repressor of the inhibitor of the protein kinase n=1 Tax=Eumeta variegata TaxID=151549 RepID=A0A4C1WN32_EUMVA|nr:52 kDa repressor of the inhibitor of the protein kinase [Eumeta japonica]